MNNNTPLFEVVREPLLANKVIKNTYMLLSMTLLFSAITAMLSMAMHTPPMASMISSIGAILLMWFVLPYHDKSASGIVVVFAITGLLGFGLGPMLNMYMELRNGPQLVATAMGGTGAIFLGLSAYALTTRKDFNFMGGFLFSGLIVLLVASFANIFLAMPLVSLTISAVAVMLMSGFILYDTSRIINGGETNYLRATIELYLDIYNLFIHLLQLLGFLSRDD